VKKPQANRFEISALMLRSLSVLTIKVSLAGYQLKEELSLSLVSPQERLGKHS